MKFITPSFAAFLVVAGLLIVTSAVNADWTTHRGNAERTGSADDQPGPSAPKVRWVYKAPEHFIAAPVPAGKSIYVSALGALNSAQFHALAADGETAGKEIWGKGAGLIKLPTVSPPAVVGDLVVFGDGMHQTDGAALYCLDSTSGRPLWQFTLEGKLVHMEGAPVVMNDRVYIGAGEAGVVCVSLRKATLDGRELGIADLRKAIESKWVDLQAAYQKARQTDPDFAVPPGDDALPKPRPVTLWHLKDRSWHVDAPLAGVGDKLLVSSAYIDFDKCGKRVVAAVSAADGKALWETPIDLNPWGGATIAGDLAIVGCSNIRFDRKLIPEAKGQIVAIEIESGKIRWKRDIPGGVLSSVAVRNGLAVFTATDGKVRAISAMDGSPKWEYAAGKPFFAGTAISGGVVYAADLAGILHALSLADGQKKWTIDATADTNVQAPGMVFGSPVVMNNEVYLATCNVEGEHADMPSVVVCISDRGPAAGAVLAKIEVDKAARTIRIPCKIAPRKLPNLKEIYPLEVVATFPAPLGQKAHETVVTYEVKPSEIHRALQETLGLSPGTPARSEDGVGMGPELDISIEVSGLGGRPLKVPLEKAIVDRRTGKPIPKLKWMFTGSSTRQPDPNKPDRVYAADMTGTLIAIFPVTDETVIQSNLTNAAAGIVKLDVNKNLLPEEGTSAVMVIRVK